MATIQTLIKLPVTRNDNHVFFAYDGRTFDLTHMVDDQDEITQIPNGEMGNVFVRSQVQAHLFEGARKTSTSPREDARAVIDVIELGVSPTETLEIDPLDIDPYEIDAIQADLYDWFNEGN